MVDIKLERGEIVTDKSGRAVRIEGIDAKFQRAIIRLNARRGKFIYNRELGSEAGSSYFDDKNPIEKDELDLNCALARLDDARVSVTDEKAQLTITTKTDNKIIGEEVRLL